MRLFLAQFTTTAPPSESAAAANRLSLLTLLICDCLLAITDQCWKESRTSTGDRDLNSVVLIALPRDYGTGVSTYCV